MHAVLFYLSILTVVSTLVPFVRHDFWIFRVFEYPRLQKLILNVALITIIILFEFPKTTQDIIVFIALILNLLYLVYLIFPFTVLGKKQIVSSTGEKGNSNLKLFIGNVYQENRKANEYLSIIAACKPDVVLLVETDMWWQQEMDFLSNDYPHQIKVPLENTYGMLLYSKYELTDGQVNYLVKKDIPSIQTLVKLPSGKLVQLFCLHPEPPVPQENPRSTERDKEILLIANKAKESQHPVIVMGDLNDVAWSYTTELFGKISGLLDPRRGRGFFNSFNAKYFFLRFPLDHIFCSADFTLSSIKRLESCGSDHFPMCVDLQYNPKAEILNDVPEATQEDKELAEEKINAEVEK
ncbi:MULTISPECIES: endonuclease/exonuclease/phosphatase family protein [Pedobacter]|uniref:endonuclease/exonuclease/phosphatase family protein n=1 Tax=Pedobacter TaxID=84567 RepID=UPI0010CEE3DA|nr:MULTISPECIES: endonuclease/exonuclease/phosphatase family protein [Pedobacter]RYD80534.1 MAG: endonuclease [Sphingobacteriales bacterium]